MWVGVHQSEWNTEGKLGQYSVQLRQKRLTFKSPPHPHFSWCVCHWKPSQQKHSSASTPGHRLTSPISLWLVRKANVNLLLSAMWNPASPLLSVLFSASWGLARRALSLAPVSTSRYTQRPPPDSIFPPQRWAPKSKLTAIHAQNTWAKAEGGKHYLGVAGKSALVQRIYEASCIRQLISTFPPILHLVFSPPFLAYCRIVRRLRF